jgi:hypothetical protein
MNTKSPSNSLPTHSFATATRRQNNMSVGSFYNVDPGISVRPPMNRETYEYFRPNESIPAGNSQEDLRAIMKMCRAAYEKVGIIRSVIDMMSEFGADGIEIIHPDKEPNAFYQAWAERIKLEDRAERGLSWLYKSGQFAVRRKFGRIPSKNLKKLKDTIPSIKDGTGNGRIPLEYTFYDPSTLELVGGSVGALSQEQIYAIRVPFQFFDGFRTPRNDLERKVFDKLPSEIKDAILGNVTGDGLYMIPIPTDKLYVGFYKKDDSDIWAKSFIYSILDDIIYNDKLKLAKTAGLDNWYNVLRVWKLGDHKEKIIPSPDAFARLSSILENNTGGGAADLIWSSDIEMEEYYPPLDKLVNFEENLHSIMLGLGVPEGLVGGKAQGSAGMTQNYLGLKNLIKRLEAGRRAIRQWLESEIDIIQKEMGFKKRPIIRFKNNDLHDEQTYYNILMQLVDRNVISDTTMLERLDEIPSIERQRLIDEQKLRDENMIPEKASPFHKPDLEQQQEHEMKKIREQGKMEIQKMDAAPDNSSNLQKKTNKVPRPAGRPTRSRDTVTRKRRDNKVKASYVLEATKIYDSIDEFTKTKLTDMFGVASVRQLNSTQEKDLEEFKDALFGNCRPFISPTEENFASAVENPTGLCGDFQAIYKELLQEAGAEKLTQDQKRILKISAFAELWSSILDEEVYS